MKRTFRYIALSMIAFCLIAAGTTPNLTPDEMARVDKGEVVVKFKEKPQGQNIRVVEATGVIDAPRERVWKVIGDYANYKEFMPQVEVSELRKREGNSAWQYQKLQIPWPFPGNGTRIFQMEKITSGTKICNSC